MTEIIDKRRPWTESDIERLMKLWPLVGSVSIIALILVRTPSSVQTRASRCGLPKRPESSTRHRRRWTDAEGELFDEAVETARQSGHLDIVGLTKNVGRSLDSTINRLVERYGSELDLLSLISVEDVIRAVAPTTPAPAPRKPSTGRGICLQCRRPFHSTGVGNWVCRPCKAQAT